MRAILAYTTSILLLVTSCNKDTTADNSYQQTRTILDTSYGADAVQKMDIYLPANRSASTKTIVLIHGGGWSEGSKTDLTTSIPTLQQLLPGYAFVNINYRLASEVKYNLFPTQENDIKAAVAFILDNQQQLGISGKLILTGFSAGAHLALLHAYKNDPGKHVQAVVDFFGPANLSQLWGAGLVQQLILTNATGKIYPDGLALYESSSPVNFITDKTPPTIVLQGGTDPLVPPSQSYALIDALEAHNVVNELVYYPNEAHGWDGNELTHSLQKVQAFIQAHVK